MSDDRLVKVFVRLKQDEDGYPPVDWEELWAADMGDGSYRIDNAPFYAKLISNGDLVTADCREGRLVFTGVISTAGHSTFRVVVYDEQLTPKLRDELKGIGCQSELSNIPTFFAVDVPPSVDYATAIRLVEGYAKEGLLDYEESALQHR